MLPDRLPLELLESNRSFLASTGLTLEPRHSRGGRLVALTVVQPCPACTDVREQQEARWDYEIPYRSSSIDPATLVLTCDNHSAPCPCPAAGGLPPERWVHLLGLEGLALPPSLHGVGREPLMEGLPPPARRSPGVSGKANPGAIDSISPCPTLCEDAEHMSKLPPNPQAVNGHEAPTQTPHLLLSPSKNQPPLKVLNEFSEERREADAKAGLELLAAMHGQVTVASTKAENVAIVTSALEDPDALHKLAEAMVHGEAATIAGLERIRAVHGLGGPMKGLTRQVKKLALKLVRQRRAEAKSLGSDLPTVKSTVPGAPLAERLRVPLGWRLSSDGLERVVPAKSPDEAPTLLAVAPSPILIIARLTDLADGSTWWVMAFERDGRWVRRIIPRERGAEARSAVKEARFDMPVTSTTAKAIVDFLAAFEAANMDSLPRGRVSRRMGWQGEKGELGFLWGRTLIRYAEGQENPWAAGSVDEADPETWPDDVVLFHADSDDGISQLADGYRTGGTYEGWRTAVLRCTPFPRVMVALYASMLPPLLPTLPSVRNFVVDLWGETSSGKTTAARVAVSAWGVPDDGAGGAMLTWAMTRVALERTSAALGHLPIVVDDTKRAKYAKLVAQVVYDFSSGKGRGRGSIEGLQRSVSTRSIMLSTGESPATSVTEDGGSRARTIEVTGQPFEGEDDPGRFVVELIQAMLENHGWAGPMLVEKLHKNRDQWPGWQRTYEDLATWWRAQADGHPIASRLSAFFAALELAGLAVNDVHDLPGDPRANLWTVWRQVMAEMGDTDTPARALRQVRSWAGSNAARFWGRHQKVDTQNGSYDRVPSHGWAGAWSDTWDWYKIAFLPTVLDDVLSEFGHEPKSIISAWHERGWLQTDAGRKKAKAGVHTDRRWCVCIKRAALIDIGEDDPPQEPPMGPPLTAGPPLS